MIGDYLPAVVRDTIREIAQMNFEGVAEPEQHAYYCVCILSQLPAELRARLREQLLAEDRMLSDG